MRPTLSCPLGAQLSPRGRWVVDHRLDWIVGWTSIPQLSLAWLQQLFPVSYTPLRELMTKPPKQTRVLLGESKGPICPYSFHWRLLELVTPEKILAGDAGDSGTWPSQATSWSTVPCGPFSDISKKQTNKQNPWLTETPLVLAEEEGKSSEI